MNPSTINEQTDVREVVRQRYADAALTVLNGDGAACCGSGTNREVAITRELYDAAQTESIPVDAMLASLGCGNPTAVAALTEGEIVLDLGSGGGIDVLLSARRVGASGFAYGLDMTDEMLALAERNRAQAGVENVEFLKGSIESIPLPDATVDVVISNCVINLSNDKPRVLTEAFRVLKPGGRFAVADVVVEGELPNGIRADLTSYANCVAGALEKAEYIALLTDAGFSEASVEPTRRYTFQDLLMASRGSVALTSLSDDEKKSIEGRVMGAIIRATKPAPCCGEGCCS